MNKKTTRLKRALKTRSKIRKLGLNRLTIHKTPRHIYAQLMSADGAQTISSASTLAEEVKASMKNGGNVAAAEKVGELIAKKASEAGITEVAFDRSGFKYHGRVKALADAARANGLKF